MKREAARESASVDLRLKVLRLIIKSEYNARSLGDLVVTDDLWIVSHVKLPLVTGMSLHLHLIVVLRYLIFLHLRDARVLDKDACSPILFDDIGFKQCRSVIGRENATSLVLLNDIALDSALALHQNDAIVVADHFILFNEHSFFSLDDKDALRFGCID